MRNIESCANCGKKFGFTESIFRKTNGLWICEDCNIKQIQENDNKDQKIAELEEKLAEKNKVIERCAEEHLKLYNDYRNLEAEYDKECCNKDQNKISFAVEKLEKVKTHNDNLVCDDEDYYNYITAFLDQLIAEIKGE